MPWSVPQINGVVHAPLAVVEPADVEPRVQLAQAQLPARGSTIIDGGLPQTLQLAPPGPPRAPVPTIDMSAAIELGTRSTVTFEAIDKALVSQAGAQPGLEPLPPPIFVATGVVVEPGLVTTAAHYVADKTALYYEATNSKGERVVGKAHVVGRAPELDVALVQLEDAHRDIPAARITTRPPRMGEPNVVIGAAHQRRDSATIGWVSGLARYSSWPLCACIQTSAGVNEGNSGGGSFNADGELMGQVMGVVPNGQTMAFLIPAATLRRLIPRLKRGDVPHVRTGMSLALPYISETLAAGRHTLEGAVVGSVHQGSPAARAGILDNDVILAIDGEKMTGIADAAVALALVEPGKKYSLLVRRGTKTLTFTITK